MHLQESGHIFQDQQIKKLRAFFIINFWCLMVSCGSFRKFSLPKNLYTVYVYTTSPFAGNWQILSSKYVFSNKELQNNTVKTAGLGDQIQAKHTQKNPSWFESALKVISWYFFIIIQLHSKQQMFYN